MNATSACSIGIADVAYWLPPSTRSLEELHAEGKLMSDVETLKSFGFQTIHVADGWHHADMAIEAVRDLLEKTGTHPQEIDMILYAASLPSSLTMTHHQVVNGTVLQLTDLMDFFKYPVSRIQEEFEMTQAGVLGVSQQGCASLLSSLRVGRDLLLAEESLTTILCVGADRFPDTSRREVIYNVISDGACAALLSRHASSNRIVSFAQITKGAYWDSGNLQDEIVAAYFPTARTVIQRALASAHLTLDDITWIIPHNVSMRSWEILLGLLNFPRNRFYGENIAKKGHTIAADNLINLKDATRAGLIRKGDYLLLFTFGFGLNWSCVILEH